MDLRKLSPRSFDWTLLLAVLLLFSIGLEAIYSVDLSRGGELILFKKQLLAAGIGLILFFLTSLTNYSFFRSISKGVYLLSGSLLFLVLFLGKTIRGTKGWFVFGGFSFQPVELAKLGLILMLAYIIANFGRRFERPLFFFGTGILTALYMVLVMGQPDLGSAILLGLIWFGLMNLVGARKLFIIGLVGVGVLGATLAWFTVLSQPSHEYQKKRILTFLNPELDTLGAGYNVAQSTIAVGAGQLFGRGLGRGSQSQLRFLPEAQTDFVFSVIGEELGFVGACLVLFLYGLIFWRLIIIMKKTQDDFVLGVVGGVVIIFFSQMMFNIGAEIGVLPLTGVTVPFVSYGGSSLIVDFIMIGLAESMVEKRY